MLRWHPLLAMRQLKALPPPSCIFLCLPAPTHHCRATLPALEVLNLQSANFSDPRGTALLHQLVCGAAGSLRELRLAGSNVPSLASMADMAQLTYLDLAGGPAGEFVGCVCGLSGCCGWLCPVLAWHSAGFENTRPAKCSTGNEVAYRAIAALQELRDRMCWSIAVPLPLDIAMLGANAGPG